VLAHEVLGELLGALQARRTPRSAEDAQAALPEQIHDPRGERRLGPHNGQVDWLARGKSASARDR